MERHCAEHNLNAFQSAALATASIGTEFTAKDNNVPGVYSSQQNLMKEKMLASGLPEDMYTAAYASFKCLIQSRYGDGNYSEDWRKWRTESRIWDYYFSPQPFPAQEPDREVDSPSMPSTTPKEDTSRKQSAVDDSAQASSNNLDQRDGIKGDAALSTTKSSPRMQYQSQGGYMSSKASFLGYRQPQFDDVLNDKYREARNKFPSESINWQNWWAESIVWAKYFKRSFFPEKEPPRASRSETNRTVRRSPSRSNRNQSHRLGADWYRHSIDQVNFYRPSANDRIDSYRPSNDERTDSYRPSKDERMDSYHPSRTISPSTVGGPNCSNNYCQEEDSSLKNVLVDNNSKLLGSRYHDTSDLTMMNVAHPNPNLKNLQFTKRSTTPQRSDTIQTTTSHAMSAVRDKQDFGPLPQGYQPMEREMVKKADLLCIRHRFFQVLQRGRDLANAQHGGCSKQYKNWFADSLTWGKLFKEPFPGKEPIGLDMHSELCALSKRNAAVASHPRASERSLEILPGNSESCWKEYAQHHNSTDLDRLLMEEQVKREGALRMVLDEHTGEVVNLKVFAIRTRLRALTNQPRNTIHGGEGNQGQRHGDTGHSFSPQKRKATGMERSNGAEKKPRR